MNRQPLILITLLLLSSCKKEKTNWNTSWSAPLVHGELTLSDLLPPEYTVTNSGNYLSIVYNESVFSFSIDTLINLPDTTIIKKTAVALPSLTVNPGFIYGDSYDQVYVLDQIELKRVIVKSGEIEMTIRSPWPGKSKLTFDFPKIMDHGNPLNRTFFMDPGSQSQPSIQSEVINMTGFDIDLTGALGLLYNTLSGHITVGSDETSNAYTVTNTDSIEYEVVFRKLVPGYAKGYFGTYTLSDTTSFDLPFMNSILAGSIDIDSVDITVNIMNGFNLIAQAKITLLQGVSSITGGTSNLNFPMLGTSININPATGGLYDWMPSTYTLAVNTANSDVAEFMENLSDSILLGYELVINPAGNITAGSDELFPTSTMDVVVNGEFPLDFSANDLTLTDTFDLSYAGSPTYTGLKAEITLSYRNGFPLGANTSLYMLDGNNTLIDSLSGHMGILSGSYNAASYLTTSHVGQVVFDLDQRDLLNLEAASKIALIVSFTTDGGQKVKIDANAFFDFNLRSNLQIRLHL